jgi:hypothetical protein
MHGRADGEAVVVDLETEFERETEERGLGLGTGVRMDVGTIRGNVMTAATGRDESRCFALDLVHSSRIAIAKGL